MNLQPLHPVSDVQSWKQGNVRVHPSATIAPGVLLQAEAGASIEIAAGVSIGMGSVIHACRGNITIAREAKLGAGVLAIGSVQIGSNACIGSSVTLLDARINARETIAPGALVGELNGQRSGDRRTDGEDDDRGDRTSSYRPQAVRSSVTPSTYPSSSQSYPTPRPVTIPSLPSPQPFDASHASGNGSSPSFQPPARPPSPYPPPSSPSVEPGGSLMQRGSEVEVYGKFYVDRLLVKMFPHRYGDRGTSSGDR